MVISEQIYNSVEKNADISNKYQQIREYEEQYDSVENEIRKLASIWLLASLGAIAFIVKLIYLDGTGDSSSALKDSKILIAIVSFMGTLGLLVLLILDLKVYLRLLNAVFLLRLRMEYRYSFIPPIGTLMMLFSHKRGMAWYMRFYYLVPMFILAIIALISSVSNIDISNFKIEFNNMSLIIGLFTSFIAYWGYIESEEEEFDKDIIKSFGDKNFEEFFTSLSDRKMMNKKKYEIILQKH